MVIRIVFDTFNAVTNGAISIFIADSAGSFGCVQNLITRVVNNMFHAIANADLPMFSADCARSVGCIEELVIRVVIAIDNGGLSLLTMPDLRAVFDKVDHTILLERPHTTFGIKGVFLKWVNSCFSNNQ